MVDRRSVARPYGIVIGGELHLGLEPVFEGSVLARFRPHTGVPEPFVLSVPFVNAHSHFEYRGLMGRVGERDFFRWIRKLTQLKSEQAEDEVRNDARTAARENRASGIAIVGEHFDRPHSPAAVREVGLGGRLFAEVITFFEHESPGERLEAASKKAAEASIASGLPAYVNPHALYTVDEPSLRWIARRETPLSLHLAESKAEADLFRSGTGPFADMMNAAGFLLPPSGITPVEFAGRLGLLRESAQLVHCCELSDSDIAQIAASGASVAHCPRSNEALSCSIAPIRRLLRSGVPVGLGLDSAASSGPVDMFAEMRAAVRLSHERGEPITHEECWQMATEGGGRSLGLDSWALAEGWSNPLLEIHVPDALSVEDLIERGSPDRIKWQEQGKS